MTDEKFKVFSEWLASLSSSELAIASLIGSVADKIDQMKVDDTDILKICAELRELVIDALNLATERQKFIYHTIDFFNKQNI